MSENDLDAKKIRCVQSALVAIPLYMIIVSFYLFRITPEIYEYLRQHSNLLPHNVGSLKVYFLYLIIPICLIGISIHSIKCIFWLNSDIFRGVAVAKYLFIILTLIKAMLNLIEKWPNNQFYFDIFQLSIFEWIKFIADIGQPLAEDIAIIGFLFIFYEHLKNLGNRQDYTFNHFLYEVSFGSSSFLGGEEYDWRI